MSSTLFTVLKDPGATLDFDIDWATNWLADGESITIDDWIVPSGITEDSASEDSGIVTIWLSGGTHGQDYKVTSTITTDAGRTDQRTILVKVRER